VITGVFGPKIGLVAFSAGQLLGTEPSDLLDSRIRDSTHLDVPQCVPGLRNEREMKEIHLNLERSRMVGYHPSAANDSNLHEAVRAVDAVLRAESDQAEKDSRLTPASSKSLREAGLFRLDR
jgi:hypothetical protein